MEPMMQWLYSMPYPLHLLIGFVLWLLIERRQFNRRGIGGLQHFDNYFTGLLTMVIERLLKWLSFLLVGKGLWGWWLSSA